jgi:hypothetical protein
MVLAKEKNEEKAMEYFIRSVHLFPMNWGCWLEMTSLISRMEDVSSGYPESWSAWLINPIAAPDVATSAPEHCFLHVPSLYVPGTLSKGT